MTSVVGRTSLSADGSDDPNDAPLTSRTRWETLLGLLILLESGRIIHYAYPTLRLANDNGLTTYGRLVWPCLAAASIYSIMRRPWLERRSVEPLVLIPIVLISASVMWSVDPLRSLNQSIILSAAVACGSFLSIAYRGRELIVLSSNTVGIVCAVNVLAAFAGVNNGTLQTTGFFEHKNTFGTVAAVGLILFLARLAARDRGRAVPAGLAVTTIALFMSGSRTSQLAGLVVALFAAFLAVRRRSQREAFALAVPMVALFTTLFLATGGVDTIFLALGKSSDLTGRTDVWPVLMSLIGERPALGWGYVAYWRDDGFAEGIRSGFEEFGLRSAHNGYLETALGAGLLTAAILTAGLVTLTLRGYRGSTMSSPRSADVALAGTGLYCIVANLSESIYPSSHLVFVIVVALSAAPRMRAR